MPCRHEGARLYEYFTLVRLLLDLRGAAFAYTGAGPAYHRNALAANFNTFTFRRGDERVRVWYQPVLYGAQHAPRTVSGSCAPPGGRSARMMQGRVAPRAL